MTREEAIKYFKRHLDFYCVDGISREAEEMAIQALSQEPCDDAISRQSVINAIENDCMRGGLGSCFACYNDAQAFRGEIEKLPPVTQKSGKWIVDGSVDCYLDKVRCHCSECGKKKEFSADYDHIKQELSISYKHPEFIDKYCPNCGAKMESEVKTE